MSLYNNIYIHQIDLLLRTLFANLKTKNESGKKIGLSVCTPAKDCRYVELYTVGLSTDIQSFCIKYTTCYIISKDFQFAVIGHLLSRLKLGRYLDRDWTARALHNHFSFNLTSASVPQPIE